MKPANYDKNKSDYLRTIDEVISKGPYNDTSESLTDMEIPRWFTHDKFGFSFIGGSTAFLHSIMNGIQEICTFRVRLNMSIT